MSYPLRVRGAVLHWARLAAVLAATGNAVGAPADDDSAFRAALTQHDVGATDAAHAGIWKAAVPRDGTTHGEFDGNDPFGLSAGAQIKADCSINWVDPDSGKRYCFSSATSLVMFLESPRRYLARARENWRGS
jgi:hypothetical protein